MSTYKKIKLLSIVIFLVGFILALLELSNRASFYFAKTGFMLMLVCFVVYMWMEYLQKKSLS